MVLVGLKDIVEDGVLALYIVEDESVGDMLARFMTP
jgi:hypothetical protein